MKMFTYVIWFEIRPKAIFLVASKAITFENYKERMKRRVKGRGEGNGM